jgi:type I restriction enzyme, S subunit
VSDLPDGWAESRFGEINEFLSSTLDPSKFKDENFELYSVPTFPTGEPEYLPGASIGSSKQIVAPQDVLVCKINPRINRVWAVADTGALRQIASSEWIVIRAPELDHRFLRYFFSSPSFRELIGEGVTGVGGSLTRAQPKRVATFVVPLAPLNEQRRIADKLDAVLARLDACRERLDRVPTILKRFRQSVLAAATSGKLTEDWRVERGRELDWKVASVGEVIEKIEAGLNVKCDERPPVASERGLVKISAVTWGTYNDDESKTLPNDKSVPETTRIGLGDFLISRANTLELVGACVIVDRVSRPVYLSDKILRLVMPEADKLWLLYVLRSDTGRQQIESLASGNQLSMRNLSQANLRTIEVPMPEEDERDEVCERVRRLLSAADQIEVRHQVASGHVDRLAPSILAKAFRGELVPQDPNDEPASALIERSRKARAEQWTKEPGRKARGESAPRTSRKGVAMTKSRQDEDVKEKPYLAAILREAGNRVQAEDLFRQADLPLSDFYKQLAWEVANGHIRDDENRLEVT